MSSIDTQLAQLSDMTSSDLRDLWRRLTRGPAPRVSPKLLRLALAWELQAQAYGGLSRETVHVLDQHARGLTKTTSATAGMRLIREWQGRAHVVTVGEDQVVRWEGRNYRSLSEVARAITGTRWSGPAFFGLKHKQAA